MIKVKIKKLIKWQKSLTNGLVTLKLDILCRHRPDSIRCITVLASIS